MLIPGENCIFHLFVEIASCAVINLLHILPVSFLKSLIKSLSQRLKAANHTCDRSIMFPVLVCVCKMFNSVNKNHANAVVSVNVHMHMGL